MLILRNKSRQKLELERSNQQLQMAGAKAGCWTNKLLDRPMKSEIH
ncbi:hypothetical protein R0I01_00875 [Bacillus pumilus]|nr:hypothetical protein R0I01_00875 [Bacillus pumilus]